MSVDWPAIAEEVAQGAGPLRERLARSLRDAVEAGDLPVGTRLPAERELAARLGVSRATVVGALEQLRQEGLLEARRGSGTYVTTSALPTPPPASPIQLVRNPMFTGLIDGPSAPIDFCVAAPPADEAVGEALRAAAQDATAQLTNPGYHTAGLPELRRAVAAYLERMGLPTEEDEVLITAGSQQAIGLAAHHFVSPGATAVTESPTYPGALDALRTVGARLLTVPSGQAGMRTEDLAALLRRTEVRLVYVIPTFHNPTGAVLPAPARRVLADLAADTQVPILEDLTPAGVELGGERPPPPVAAGARRGTVLVAGSLSKLCWGGLRIGWLRGPQLLIARLARLKAALDLACPVVTQLAAARLLPVVDEVQARRREQLAPRLDLLRDLLRAYLPDWRWQEPMGGLTLWVRVPEGDTADFAAVALQHGVAIVPGRHFCADGRGGDHLRLTFALAPSELETGVERLARAWSAYEGASRPEPLLQPVV
jgi:DNA-binding transcriptional MocR family regulator